MTVNFNEIPSGTLTPGSLIEYNARLALRGLPANVKKVILLAQKRKNPSAWAGNTAKAAGAICKPTTLNGHLYFCVTAGTTGTPTEPTWPTTEGGTVTDGTAVWKEFADDSPLGTALSVSEIFADSDAKDAGGEGSVAHLMAYRALKKNPYLNLFLICEEDATASVNATGTYTVTGTPTGAGTIRVGMGNDYVEASFIAAESVTDIATAIVAAIATKRSLPCVSKSAAGVATAIFKHGGTVGNQLPLWVEYTTSGSLAIAASVMSGGTTDPDIHATGHMLDLIAPVRYHNIATAWNDATTLGYLKTHVNSVSDYRNKLSCKLFPGLVNTIANCQTQSLASNFNRAYFTCAKATFTPPYELSAIAAALDAAYTNPAQPRNNAVLTGVAAPAAADRYIGTEIESMLHTGLTPTKVASDETVRIVRMVSSYRDSLAWLDITVIDSIDYLRDVIKDLIDTEFPDGKLTGNMLDKFRSRVISKLLDMEAPGVEILRNVEANLEKLVVEEDGTTPGQVNVRVPAAVVPGAHVFAVMIDVL